MKKRNLICLVVIAAIFVFASWTVAGQPSSTCPVQPTGFVCPSDSDSVNFDWDTTDCDPGIGTNSADKYSVDIYYGSADGLTLIETCYGTSDRTDGLPMSASQLEVPLADLTALLIPCGEDVAAKVKALEMTDSRNIEKANQKNPWSDVCVFQIACP